MDEKDPGAVAPPGATAKVAPGIGDTERLGSLAVRQAAPFLGALLFIASIQLVDVYFVARLGGETLAAYGYATPVLSVVLSLLMGIGQGITACVSRRRGEGNALHAASLARAGIVFALGGAAVLGLLGTAFAETILQLQGATAPIAALGARYLQLNLLGMVVPAFAFAATAVLRAYGDMKSTVQVMGYAAACNLVLAPFCIVGVGPVRGLGLTGAAYAMIGGYVVAGLVAYRRLRSTQSAGSLLERSRHPWTEHLRELAASGVPAAIAQGLVPISLVIMTALVADFGDDAVIAIGVVSRIDRVVMMIPTALGGALAPLVGLCWGGGQVRGAMRAVRHCTVLGVSLTLPVALACLAAPDAIAMTLVPDSAAQGSLVMALRWLPLAYPAASVVRLMVSVLTAIGAARIGSQLYVIRTVAVLPIFLALGARTFGLVGFMAGALLSEVVAAAALLGALARFVRSVSTTYPRAKSNPGPHFEQVALSRENAP